MNREASRFDRPFLFCCIRFVRGVVWVLGVAAIVFVVCMALAEAEDKQSLLTPYQQLKIMRQSTPREVAQLEPYNGRLEDPYRESMVFPVTVPVSRPKIKSALSRVEVDLVPQLDKTLAVNAVVNRKHVATFVIDTGASYTVITPRTARAWGLRPSVMDQTLTVTTANGMIEAPMVILKNVNLGGMDLNNVQAVVIDLGENIPAAGLLGMNFFEGFEFIVRPNKLILNKLGNKI